MVCVKKINSKSGCVIAFDTQLYLKNGGYGYIFSTIYVLEAGYKCKNIRL